MHLLSLLGVRCACRALKPRDRCLSGAVPPMPRGAIASGDCLGRLCDVSY